MSKRIYLGKNKTSFESPHLLDIQLSSFNRFIQVTSFSNDSEKSVFYRTLKECFPISDSKNNFTLELLGYSVGTPRYSEEFCKENDITYAVPLKIKLRLTDYTTGKKKATEEIAFLGNIPYMTPKATFIIRGIERVIVSQIHRAYNAFFTQNKHISGAKLYSAKIIPERGSWVELVTDINNRVYVYIGQKKKFPVTLLLRAIGYGTDREILNLFDLAEEVKANKKSLNKYIGRKLSARVLRMWTEEYVDEETSEITMSLERTEVVVERGTVLDKDIIELIIKTGVEHVMLSKEDVNNTHYQLIYNTLQKDATNSEKEGVIAIYRQIRNTEPPDEQTAKEFIQQALFSAQRSFLGRVGRYAINKKLGLNIPLDVYNITKEDFLSTLKHFLNFVDGKVAEDDIDNLINKRVKTVGEQLREVYTTGINRLVRVIRERMNSRDEFTPVDLINTRSLFSVVDSFYSTDPLSQMLSGCNPLSEIVHKRIISCLGKRGLSREHAGADVRDTNMSHYAKIGVVMTPEGANIGLILSLTTLVRINKMGFLEAPYFRVIDGKVDSKQVHYLSSEEEDKKVIAQGSSVIKDGLFKEKKVSARKQGEFINVSVKEVDYVDVSCNQILSVASGLIPFIERCDARRALMGGNMQAQAVPLVESEVPIVGTGIEDKVAKNFGGLSVAEGDGEVVYVDSNKIVVSYSRSKEEEEYSFRNSEKTYNLKKLDRTNQGTCFNEKPSVRVGDKVNKGKFLTEGFAIREEELALGRNVRVAYMAWDGSVFEDAIVVSSRLVEEGYFTSMHIHEFTQDVCETSLGPEELTSEIPSLNERLTRKLDPNGMVRTGESIKGGDQVILKIAPKIERELLPEELLLKAIFGEKASSVSVRGVKAPPGFSGIAIGSKILSRANQDKKSRVERRAELDNIKKQSNFLLKNMAEKVLGKLCRLLEGSYSTGIKDSGGKILIPSKKKITSELIKTKLFRKKNRDNRLSEAIYLNNLDTYNWTTDSSKNKIVGIILESYKEAIDEIINKYIRLETKFLAGDQLPDGVNKRAKLYVADKRPLEVGDKMAGRYGNKGIVSRIVPREDMPFFADGTQVDMILSPLGVTSRMNIGQNLESILGWAGSKLGKKYTVGSFDSPTLESINKEMKEAGLPAYGLTQLYDGYTGEPFKELVTCGVSNMIKLNHMVRDKIHARSTGPYLSMTNQPSGGRSQFGGQRLGEMEIWALEAYGAAYTILESMTIKSDDVRGRSKAYEAIVKGNVIPEPGVSESCKVLVHKIQALGMEVTIE